MLPITVALDFRELLSPESGWLMLKEKLLQIYFYRKKIEMLVIFFRIKNHNPLMSINVSF